MDKVVHFEIPVDDVERARAFYASVFDWAVVPMNDMQYTLVMTTAVDEKTQRPTEPGAINGGLKDRDAITPGPVITLQVDGIDESLKKVEAEGGSVITPRTSMGDVGFFAYFKDSEGNVMGLFERP